MYILETITGKKCQNSVGARFAIKGVLSEEDQVLSGRLDSAAGAWRAEERQLDLRDSSAQAAIQRIPTLMSFSLGYFNARLPPAWMGLLTDDV